MRTAFIQLNATIPDGWEAEDVLDEIEELMRLSGQEVKPEFLAGSAHQRVKLEDGE